MSSTITETTTPTSTATSRFRWRVVDIVVAAVLGVAIGLVFFGWNFAGGALHDILNVAVPGLGGSVGGVWLLGGVLGALVIRKPGAAIFVELVAALIAALIGSAWGVTSLISGLAQGLGAEIIFLIFAYRRWNLPVAMLAGLGSAILETIWEFIWYYPAQGFTFKAVYGVSMAVSGIVLAGVLGWLLVRGLAATGVLNRFEAGREAKGLV
jgi:energy-coupling factor transport system substrate-specific component